MFSIKTISIIVIGIIISLIGYNLRLNKFFHFPPIGDTQDEVKAPFLGINLLKDGVPRSWSWYPQYGEFPSKQIRNANYRIVEPWFDEPALFGVMMGIYGKWKGITEMDQVDAGVFRRPMIIVSALNILLLFLIIYQIEGLAKAAASSLIYATAPTIVFGTRLPISDNMLATFALVSIFLLLLYNKYKRLPLLLLTALIAAATLHLKSTGVFVSMGLIFVLLSDKKYKQTAIIGTALLVSLLAWLYYGYLYGWDIFRQIAAVSSGRELFQPGNLIAVFTAYKIGESNASVDGWLIWGWISLIAYQLLNRGSKSSLSKLILPAMMGSYLVFFSIMSGHIKGHYRFPFFPFLSWAGGYMIVELIKNPRFLPSLFFLGIPVASSWIYGTGEHKFSNREIRLFQYFFVSITGVLMANEVFKNIAWKKVAQVIIFIAFAASIILNIRTTLFFQDQFWYQ